MSPDLIKQHNYDSIIKDNSSDMASVVPFQMKETEADLTPGR